MPQPAPGGHTLAQSLPRLLLGSLRADSGHHLVAASGTAPSLLPDRSRTQGKLSLLVSTLSPWDGRARSNLASAAATPALTWPQESGGQRWLWQRIVPATQEQLVQASTSQCSPTAT